MRYIGVDIGSHSIKCVLLKKIKDSYLIHLKKIYLCENKPLSQKWLKLCLQDFTKYCGIKRPIFYFSFPQDMPFPDTKIFKMPKVNRKELSQSLHYEVEEKNMLQSGLSYKWSVIKTEDDMQDVLVSVAEKNLIKTIKGLKSPLWFPAVIEPQVISFGRLAKESCAVIDFGHNSTRLLIFKDGLPFTTSAIGIGGAFFTQKIAEGRIFLNEFEELRTLSDEAIKHEYGAILRGFREIEDNPITKKISDLLDESAAALAREIKQALRVVEINNDFKPDTIYFTGEGSKLRYLTNYIERELNEELIPLNFVSSPEEDVDNFPFMAASGTWLYKEYPYFKSINFMLADDIKIDFQKVFFAVLGFSLVLHIGMYDLNKRTENITAELKQQLEIQRQTAAMLQNKISEKENKTARYIQFGNKLTQLQQQKRWLSDVLFEIPERTPERLVVANILIYDNRIFLSGAGPNYSDVAFFAIALEELGNVVIQSVKNDNGAHNFIIELIIK